MQGTYLILLFTLSTLTSLYAECLFDNGRLYPSEVQKVVRPTTEQEVLAIFNEAKASHTSIAFVGKKHSQGGQTLINDGIVMDITGLNRIPLLDISQKRIIIQSGVTWEQIQERVNPHGLAIKIMQSSNIFTVGGSLSVNAHGRDPRYGPMIESVKALKIMLADGSVIWIDRNHELFGYVIGGYGLFGIILEVELALTENTVLTKDTEILNIESYPDYFESNVKGRQDAELHFARFYIGPEAPLSSILACTYYKTGSESFTTEALQSEKNVKGNKALLQLLRKTDWAKKAIWKMKFLEEYIDTIVSRNNAMRPPILCLDYKSSKDTDILQEYFIPVARFKEFGYKLKDLLERHPINVLNITIRYVKKDAESVLSYAKEDSFAFVLYVNQGLNEEARAQAEHWTREIIDAALELGGTYYLPYQRYPTFEQLLQAYPNMETFLKMKQQYDPENLFLNDFFRNL